MNSPLSSDAPPPLEREDLVAYLDGELEDERTRQRIEDTLAVDADFREEVQHLERAWDLLDSLPRAEVSEEFTHTTVEMVAVDASEAIEAARQQRPRRLLRWWLMAGGVLFLAGLLGVSAPRWFTASPEERLLRELPVLDRLEQYQQVRDVEFLRRLDEQEVFNDESD